jgi:hypothetical protein
MSKSGKAVLVAAAGALGAFAVRWAVSRTRLPAQFGLKAVKSRSRATRDPDASDEFTGHPLWLRLPEPIGKEWWQYLEEEGYLDTW